MLQAVINGRKIYGDQPGMPENVDGKATFSNGAWIDLATGETYLPDGGYLCFDEPPKGEEDVLDDQTYTFEAPKKLILNTVLDGNIAIHAQAKGHNTVTVKVSGIRSQTKDVQVTFENGVVVIDGSAVVLGAKLVFDEIAAGDPDVRILMDTVLEGAQITLSRQTEIVDGVVVQGVKASLDPQIKLLIDIYIPNSLPVEMDGSWDSVEIGETNVVCTIKTTGCKQINIVSVKTLTLDLLGPTYINVFEVGGNLFLTNKHDEAHVKVASIKGKLKINSQVTPEEIEEDVDVANVHGETTKS